LAPFRFGGDRNLCVLVVGIGEKVECPNARPSTPWRLKRQPRRWPAELQGEHPSGRDLDEPFTVGADSTAALLEEIGVPRVWERRPAVSDFNDSLIDRPPEPVRHPGRQERPVRVE